MSCVCICISWAVCIYLLELCVHGNTKCCSMEIQNVFPWKVKLVLVKSKFRTGQQWLVVKRVIVNTDCEKGHCEHWLLASSEKSGSLWTLTAGQLWKISFTQHWFSGQIQFHPTLIFWSNQSLLTLKVSPVVGWHFCPAKMSPYKATVNIQILLIANSHLACWFF